MNQDEELRRKQDECEHRWGGKCRLPLTKVCPVCGLEVLIQKVYR